jgi:hypothetical protein
MSIAKGSKSALIYALESTLGVIPTAVTYTGLQFKNENLVENIGEFKSQDIRPDRTVPGLRGGNIECGGDVTCDFGLQRHMLFFKHLLAGTVVKTTMSTDNSGGIQIAALTAQVYTRGQFVKSTGGIFVCEIGGTVTSGDVSAGLTITAVGTQQLTNTRWAWVHADGTGTLLYQYVITPGASFPTVGLAFEKQIIGGSSAEYVAFNGGRVNSLDLNIQQKGVIETKWALLFFGSQSSSATIANPSGTPAYPTEDPVAGYDAFISLNSGQAVRPLTQASLNITNGVDGNCFVLGSRSRIDLPEGERMNTMKVTTYFQDATEYNFFKGENIIPVDLSFSHGGDFMVMHFGECKLTGSGTPQITGPGPLTASYNIDAFRETGSIDMTLTLYSVVNNLVT